MKLHEALPYVEPSYGKHAAPMGRDQAREEAIEYVTNGRRILPGWGKHRKTNAEGRAAA